MQRILAHRLLQRGSMACEFLAVWSHEALDNWSKRINDNFRETTGRIGFPEAPIEVGDFSDWLTSGRHPARDSTGTESVPCEAASFFSVDECDLLFSKTLVQASSKGRRQSDDSKAPDVFVSYATGDFAFASSACSYLEDSGIVCWMAPRDINRDALPYTEAIAAGLGQVKAVVVFLSETANLSVHIPRELDIALERKLSIIPVRLQDLLPAGQLNYLLRTCQWLNAFDRSYRDAIDELLERLRRLLK
jgi:hypothetical protein